MRCPTARFDAIWGGILCSKGSRFGFPGPHFLAVGVRAVPYSEAHFARLGAHCGSPGRHFWLSDPKPRRHRLELGPHVDQMEQHVNTFGIRTYLQFAICYLLMLLL